MKQLLLALLLAFTVTAQNGASPIIATPSEQAEIKTLRETEARAATALNAAIEKLPESAAYNRAKANTLDAAYAAMAKHGLSSRQYEPRINDKGELEFARLKTTPQ